MTRPIYSTLFLSNAFCPWPLLGLGRLAVPVKLNTSMGGAVDWRENNRQGGSSCCPGGGQLAGVGRAAAAWANVCK